MPQAVIGINGPVESGKSTFASWLKGALRDVFLSLEGETRSVEIFQIQPYIFAGMLEEGITDGILDYKQFKALPDGRARIIEYAEREREKDKNVFLKRMCESQQFKSIDVAIYDNVGFSFEANHFSLQQDLPFFSVLSILRPYHHRGLYRVDVGGQYPDDSRTRVFPYWGWAENNSKQLIHTTAKVIEYARLDPEDRRYSISPRISRTTINRWRYHVLGITD